MVLGPPPPPPPPPPPLHGVTGGVKGKGKEVASSGAPSPMEKSTSPPSLEALMLDTLLFEESLLKDPNEEVISALGVVYGEEALKGVQELLKDATPFRMTNSISIFF